MRATKTWALSVLTILVVVPFARAGISWDSSFTVVNLGVNPAHVWVSFYDESGTEYSVDPLVPGEVANPFYLEPGDSQIIVLAYVNASLPAGRYSAVVSADQPVVTIANLVGLEEGVTTQFNGSYSGFANTGQTSIYMPSVNKDFYCWDSHLSIQNLTSSAMDIVVAFYDDTGSNIHNVQQNVPAFASWLLDVQGESILPSDYNGSAVVSAGGPIAVVDNQVNFYLPSDPNCSPNAHGGNQVYRGITNHALTVYCPGVYDQFPRGDPNGPWFSSLSVQNVGSEPTDVQVYYSDGTSESVDDLPAFTKHLFLQGDGSHNEGYFSAKIVSESHDGGPTPAQPLVVLANASTEDGAQAQTYECFTYGNDVIYTPLVMKLFVGAFNTGVHIQNIGTADVSVVIEYEEPGCSEGPSTVAAGGTHMFYPPGASCLPTHFSGAATVTASKIDPGDPDPTIVGIINQTNDEPGSATGDLSLSFSMILESPP